MVKLIILSFISFSLMADTIEGIEPELNYNYDTLKSIRFENLTDQKIEVVIEEVTFPSKSRLAKKQKKKFLKALSILGEVLNSEEFRIKVLSYVRPGHTEPGYQKNYLWKNKNERLSPLDIYNIIMEGNEKMFPSSLGEMNIKAWTKVCSKISNIWRKWCKKVIGSTNPSESQWMKLNWNFYKKFETHQMVSNIVHEWIHLLGFLHGPSSTMRMEVPYVVGAIAGEVAKNLLSQSSFNIRE